jgi:hypothetical protein
MLFIYLDYKNKYVINSFATGGNTVSSSIIRQAHVRHSVNISKSKTISPRCKVFVQRNGYHPAIFLLVIRAVPIKAPNPDKNNQTAAGIGTADVEEKLMLSYNMLEGV